MFPKNSREDRYSVAYFCHPADELPLEPVPSSVVQDHVEIGVTEEKGNAHSIMTAGEYLKSKLQATYQFS